MIIYGWSTKFRGAKNVEGECPACRSRELRLLGYQKVFDIFWIPVIPLKRSSYVECCSCGECYEPKAILGERVAKAERFSIPFWSFSGLFVILLLIAGGMYLDASMKEEVDAFRKHPEAGTFFTFKDHDEAMKETPYIFGKVLEIDEQGIIVAFGDYAYSSKSKANSASKDANINMEDLFLIPTGEFHNLDIVHCSSSKSS